MSVNHSKDRILVTGASGKQAALLLPFLIPKWKNVRLAVNSDTSRDRMKNKYPGAEVVQVDLAEPKECRNLLDGVTAVYHINPTMHPRETEIGYYMIDAAIAQGDTFKHFVFSSVLNTQLRGLLNHDRKRYVVGPGLSTTFCFWQSPIIADCRSTTYAQHSRRSTCLSQD